jgi:hypothetical protein
MPDVSLFAANLYNPTHMNWTRDGRLLVAETTAGQITDITDGGDMKNADRFAWGLEGPAAIVTLTDGRLLCAESWGGSICEITGGGDMSGKPRVLSGLALPYSMVVWPEENQDVVYYNESIPNQETWISRIVLDGAGDGVAGAAPSVTKHIHGVPTRYGAPGMSPLSRWPDHWVSFATSNCGSSTWGEVSAERRRMYHASGTLGVLFDSTEPASSYMDIVDSRGLIAWGLGHMGGIKLNPTDSRLYAVAPERGHVVAIDPELSNQDCTFAPPVVAGLSLPNCLRFSSDGRSMFVCGRGDGVIWEISKFN